MKIFSKAVEKRLMYLSTKTDDIYTGYSISLLRKGTRSKKIKVNDDNLKKITSQLPHGVYRTVTELINVIEQNILKNVGSSITYSPLILDRNAFKPCKRLSYSKGNIITGRDTEIADILLTLGKKDKRGVILIGEPGTGKTAIVRAVNARLKDRNVPRPLIGCQIHHVDLPYIFTMYKEDPVGTIIKILEQASSDNKHILFIDEVHQLLSQKMNDVLKPYLTEQIRFIGSTTIDEYHTIVTDDRALERRFTIINVLEPNVQQTVGMVIGTKSVYEEYHKCSIPDDVVEHLVQNGSRFLGHRKNPDKALDLLDIACTILHKNEVKTEIKEIDDTGDELLDLDNERKKIDSMEVVAGYRTLTKHYADMSISTMTGIDYNKIRNSLNYDYVAKSLKEVVFGQEEHLNELANVVNIITHINFDQDKPLSTMLLVGPPGCGKSTSVKTLADLVYGSQTNLIDYDMGAFTSEFMISELKGAPPGYVGYGKSGRLIKEIRNKPQSIVYFRNINKCHQSIIDYLLTSIRKGKMTDSAEREVRLNNTIIIFSATLSSAESKELARKSNGMGFSKPSEGKDNLDVIKKILSPDLVASVDSMIMYNEANEETLRRIYKANVTKYLEMYRKIDINLDELEENVMSDAKNGHDVITGLQANVPKMIFKKFKNLK